MILLSYLKLIKVNNSNIILNMGDNRSNVQAGNNCSEFKFVYSSLLMNSMTSLKGFVEIAN
jgi:hypothetical protein